MSLLHCREYKILNLLEFNSTRKRMSVVVRDESGQILLMCKGADRYVYCNVVVYLKSTFCILNQSKVSHFRKFFHLCQISSYILHSFQLLLVPFTDGLSSYAFLGFYSIIYERLGRNGKVYWNATKGHLAKYGDAGLRTLALSYRILEEAEYQQWNQTFTKAKTTIGPDRDELLDKASELIERDLFLVGATAVEDKLQEGVSFTICYCISASTHVMILKLRKKWYPGATELEVHRLLDADSCYFAGPRMH